MTTVAPAALDAAPLPCPGCGYDLRGAVDGSTQGHVRCSECGRESESAELHAEAAIPWHDRHHVGRVRAFLKTTLLALRHPVRLAEQTGRPVDYRAARRYHVICCVLAAATLGWPVWEVLRELRPMLMGSGLSFFGWGPPTPETGLAMTLDVLVVVVALLGLFPWLITTTGIATYFCHPGDLPRQRQDSAIGLCYYAVGAPLVLLAVSMACITLMSLYDAAAQTVDVAEAQQAFRALMLMVAGIFLLGTFAWSVLTPGVLLVRGLHRSAGRVLAMAATMSVAAPLLFVLWVLLPALLMLWLESVVLMLLT